MNYRRHNNCIIARNARSWMRQASWVAKSLVVIVCFSTSMKFSQADITYDFSVNPITWDASAGMLTWDADGDTIDDFQVSVVSGFIDPTSGLYSIDNISTSSGGIVKTLVFSVSAINPAFSNCMFDQFGFDLFSEKNIEPGGTGGAGSIGMDVFDDSSNELLNSLNVSGSLGSNPTTVAIPGVVSSAFFELAVDLDSPPNNDDAQIILGDFVFNAGTVHCTAPIPESGSCLVMFAVCLITTIRRSPKIKRSHEIAAKVNTHSLSTCFDRRA